MDARTVLDDIRDLLTLTRLDPADKESFVKIENLIRLAENIDIRQFTPDKPEKTEKKAKAAAPNPKRENLAALIKALLVLKALRNIEINKEDINKAADRIWKSGLANMAWEDAQHEAEQQLQGPNTPSAEIIYGNKYRWFRDGNLTAIEALARNEKMVDAFNKMNLGQGLGHLFTEVTSASVEKEEAKRFRKGESKVLKELCTSASEIVSALEPTQPCFGQARKLVAGKTDDIKPAKLAVSITPENDDTNRFLTIPLNALVDGFKKDPSTRGEYVMAMKILITDEYIANLKKIGTEKPFTLNLIRLMEAIRAIGTPQKDGTLKQFLDPAIYQEFKNISFMDVYVAAVEEATLKQESQPDSLVKKALKIKSAPAKASELGQFSGSAKKEKEQQYAAKQTPQSAATKSKVLKVLLDGARELQARVEVLLKERSPGNDLMERARVQGHAAIEEPGKRTPKTMSSPGRIQ